MKYLTIQNGAIQEVEKQGDLSLEEMQRLVGGWIELVTLRTYPDESALSMYVNEEGKLDGLPPNFYFHNIQDLIVGPAIIIGTDAEGRNRSLTPDEIKAIKLDPAGEPGRSLPWPQLMIG